MIGMDPSTARSWEALLLSVLTDADRELGFGPSWEGAWGTSERLPSNSDLARIDVGGLQRNRVLGLIEVDFGARRLRFVSIDYYGGDEMDERELPPEFWTAATQVPWPIRD
jgi:hypothetical protein